MKQLILTVLLLLITSTSVFATNAADQKKQGDYKCYLGTSAGMQVFFYRWPVSDYQQQMATLVGSYGYTQYGYGQRENHKVYIRSVKECALLHDEFISTDAKNLDKKTPR